MCEYGSVPGTRGRRPSRERRHGGAFHSAPSRESPGQLTITLTLTHRGGAAPAVSALPRLGLDAITWAWMHARASRRQTGVEVSLASQLVSEIFVRVRRSTPPIENETQVATRPRKVATAIWCMVQSPPGPPSLYQFLKRPSVITAVQRNDRASKVHGLGARAPAKGTFRTVHPIAA